jgi:hypothetical protein
MQCEALLPRTRMEACSLLAVVFLLGDIDVYWWCAVSPGVVDCLLSVALGVYKDGDEVTDVTAVSIVLQAPTMLAHHDKPQ